MGTRGSFPGVKHPGGEADHSHPSSAEVKECVELYLHFPSTPPWLGAQFKKNTGTTLPLISFNLDKISDVTVTITLDVKVRGALSGRLNPSVFQQVVDGWSLQRSCRKSIHSIQFTVKQNVLPRL
jgi:hypothetical protein